MADKDKDLEELRGMQYAFEEMKWSGWGSPIGLSIFFLVLSICIAIIKFTFFPF